MGVSGDEEVYFSCPYCGRRYEKVRMFSKKKVQCQKCHRAFTVHISDGVVVIGTLPNDPVPRLGEYIKCIQEAGEDICKKADRYHFEIEVAKEEHSVNDELPILE